MKRYLFIFFCSIAQIHGMEQSVEHWSNSPEFRDHFRLFLGDIYSYKTEPLVGGLLSQAPILCTVNDKKYVVRIFKGSPDIRQIEVAINYFVADKGIAPKIYHHGHHDDFSFIIMDFVDVSTLSFEQAVRRVAFDSVAQKVKLIAEFDATMETKNKETYFDEGISHYKSLKQKKLVNLNPILEEIKDKMEVVAQKINSYDRPLVMNHNDFQPRNMFFAHDDIVVIDWEFIGLNYEFADLAAYSIFFCLNEEDDFYLLTKYLQYVPSRDDEGYYKMVKLMTRVLYILSFFELVDYIPEVESIKYFKHYAALFAQDTISDSSDFFYEFSMSQLQELRREYEKFESLQ